MSDIYEENALERLHSAGQSIWYDNISRSLLTEGHLARMIAEDAVVGVTSNPSIFHKAIAESAAYDEAIKELVESKLGTREILEILTAQDIAMAADVLRPVWENTQGKDGWVSIEVSPHLAYDAETTVADAHRVAYLVDRPNVLVKVPATEPGVQAIQRLIGQGACINVTLIFSLDRYREVMEAYIAGLEDLAKKLAAGEKAPALADVASVASFFVSRVDSKVDALLEARAKELRAEGRGEEADEALRLRGKAAVANAKLAYRECEKTFSGPRWEALEAQGARVQRPLWASTSTKNPDYRDVIYVEELIGPQTVNTLPQATLEAFRDHGVVEPTLTLALDEAKEHFAALERFGVDIKTVTDQLEAEGVQAFVNSWDALLEVIDTKAGRAG